MKNAASVAEIARPGASPTSDPRPVDLVHLARQTLNDRRVEREVLRLFLRQSAVQLARLARAETPAERKMAAHTIVGAARGIGAWEVARLATEIEQTEPGNGVDLARLTLAIDEAGAYIHTLLGDDGR